MNVSVGIILGSASDKPVAEKAVKVLEKLQTGYEITVASAHRTPDDVENYVRSAEKRGIKVFIAVAGLSAALPGVVAASTFLPVIGLPVESGSLKGMDALLSVAQMPPGVPVAAVGIDAGANAGVLAARIIAVSDSKVKEALKSYVAEQAQKVRTSREQLAPLNQPPEF